MQFTLRWLVVVTCASDSPELRDPRRRVWDCGALLSFGMARSEFLLLLFFFAHLARERHKGFRFPGVVLVSRSETGGKFVGPGVSPLRTGDSLCAAECTQTKGILKSLPRARGSMLKSGTEHCPN